MQKYEYTSYEFCVPRSEQEKEVLKMAKQGWRLVVVVDYVFWFERLLTQRAADEAIAPEKFCFDCRQWYAGEHDCPNPLRR